MEKVLIFGNTQKSRELAQTMRRRGKQVIVSVTSEFAKSKLPIGTYCQVGRFDEGQMLAYIQQVNPRRVIDATQPYAVTAQRSIQHACEMLNIEHQRVTFENEQEVWREVVQWVDNPAEAMAAIAAMNQENVLLAGDYRYLPHYVPFERKERLYCRIAPTPDAISLAYETGIPPQHIVAINGPYTKAFNSALFDMLNIDVLVMRDVLLGGGLAECVIPALERQMQVIMVRNEQV